MVKSSSGKPKVPGSIQDPGLMPGSWIVMRHGFMHLTPGFPNVMQDLSPFGHVDFRTSYPSNGSCVFFLLQV